MSRHPAGLAVLAAFPLLLLSLAPLVVAAQAESPAQVPALRALSPDGRLPLEGTPWRLASYRAQGGMRTPGPEVAARMQLVGGRITASGGCTSIGGRYGVAGGAIAFRLRGLEQNDCAEQTTMVQLAMVEGLRRADGLEIVAGAEAAADQLVLRSATGVELLRFRLDDIDALDTAEWRLAAYTVGGVATPADPAQPAVLSLDPSRSDPVRRTAAGALTGSTGCNGVIGEFARQGDVLSLGPLEMTDAPCGGALATQQEAMLSVLEATALQISSPPDRLSLIAVEDGDRLDFVSARPLEGSTWLLDERPATPPPSDPVTLRLADGQAEGEGPCGPYAARYVTDGYFITFSDVAGPPEPQGSPVPTCPVAGRERAFFGGLRRAVILDRDQRELRLLDSLGRVVLRFDRPGGP